MSTKVQPKKSSRNSGNALVSRRCSPMAATSFNKVCKLVTDNYATKDFWIITDGVNVTICKQKMGSEAEESVTVPVKDFNRLIAWYTREQTVNGG